MLPLAFIGTLSIAQIAIAAIIIAGVIAIAYIAMKALGVQPPSWVIQVLWVLLIVVVCVLAVKFLVSLW